MPRLTKGERLLGALGLAASDPGAFGLSPELVNLPDQATLAGVVSMLLYGVVVGDRKVKASARVDAELSTTSGHRHGPEVDPTIAAEVLEQCRRAGVDPHMVAEAVASRRERV